MSNYKLCPNGADYKLCADGVSIKECASVCRTDGYPECPTTLTLTVSNYTGTCAGYNGTYTLTLGYYSGYYMWVDPTLTWYAWCYGGEYLVGGPPGGPRTGITPGDSACFPLGSWRYIPAYGAACYGKTGAYGALYVIS
jgi:hypothetical protein